MQILLVEDDEVDVISVKRAFKNTPLQHNLTVTGNGIEALEYLRKEGTILPQVILLDINMPQMGGHEFLKELRADSKLRTCVVFVMSTSSNPTDKSLAFGQNVAGYIVKPISSDKFKESLDRLVGLWSVCEFP